MQNVAISRFCFVNYCKQRQRNEQRIITHAYTAIVLVAVAVEGPVNRCRQKLDRITDRTTDRTADRTTDRIADRIADRITDRITEEKKLKKNKSVMK